MNEQPTSNGQQELPIFERLQEPGVAERRPRYETPASMTDRAGAVPDSVLEQLQEDAAASGEPFQEPAIYQGCNGRTMFDSTSSEDNTVTVLLPYDQLGSMPAQSLVRINSFRDGHVYLGMVVKGPFAEPDGLRADAPVIVTTTVRGGVFMPRYHGRVQVELLGEELEPGIVEPPRFRPLPNSPVFVLSGEETARVMQTQGQIRLGLAIGHQDMPVAMPLTKAVLPRHTGILGTTGGGKSTTVSGMIGQLQRQGAAVVLIDTEGEYTTIDQPTEDPRMLARLKDLGRGLAGVADTELYHLVGRETANPKHARIVPFSLRFDQISPYALVEILGFNDAQEQRFFKAYDVTKQLLERLGIYPRRGDPDDLQHMLDVDELERGWPSMTLGHIHDVVAACAQLNDKDKSLAGWRPATPGLSSPEARSELERLLKTSQLEGHVGSWRTVQGKLGRLRRLRIFDDPRTRALNFAALTQPGHVSILDLSDTDSPQVNNLAIAELLRGVMEQQDVAYDRAIKAGKQPTPVVVFIEEAHEFLSAERIKHMETLFQQVARIAKRGRKRWLGLVFITQLPQHLPDEVLGLINNWILHKVSDANVITRLRRSIGGVDDSLWQRVPSLAPGQAVVSYSGLTRPLLVAIDPTPCKLQMID